MSDYIPPELLLKIFSKLPAKSLVRFMSVSKVWYTMISNPRFIETHLTESSNRPYFVLNRFTYDPALEPTVEQFTFRSHDGTVTDYVKLDCPLKTDFWPRFVGACNGLFCLCDEGFPENQTIALWNPSIRRHLTLPSPRIPLKNKRREVCYISFGFDLKNKDYKVVRIVMSRRAIGTPGFASPKAEVYSLRSGCWKTLSSVDPSCGLSPALWYHVSVNGACVRFGSMEYAANAYRIVLLSFDLGDEEMRVIETPDAMNDPGFIENKGLHLFQNMLSVYRAQQTENGSTLSIWVMKEFGVVESWTKQYCFNVEGEMGLSTRYHFFFCSHVECLALLSGSSKDVQAPIHSGDFVLPNWATKGGNGEEEEHANRKFIDSITYAFGNLVEFLLPN